VKLGRRPEGLVSFRFVRIARLFGIAAVYVVACRVMLAPICNFSALSSATYEGDVRLVVWALAWGNHAVIAGLPLFSANIFYPTPASLAYGEHFIGIGLFSLPVFLLTDNPVLAYNVVWLLSYLLSAWAAHYLTWRLTRDHLAALVSGLTYAFCFYRMHHGHGHLHLLWGFWIPISMIVMERWIATRAWRQLWLLVTILTLQALASWYQAVMIFVADAVLLVWLTIVEPALDGRWTLWTAPRITRLMAQAVAGAAVALVAVWPFARHYRVLASGGPAEAAAASADLIALLMPPQNTMLGQWLIHSGVAGPRWIWGELTVYLGWGTLLLAVAGAAAAIGGRTEWLRRCRFFILLGLVAGALAWGPSAREIADNQWHWSAFGILARIPGAELFRAPARFAALLTLALSALAGAACARLHERFGTVARWVTALAIPVLLAESYVVKFPSGQPQPFPIPTIYHSVATLPSGPLVSLPDYVSSPAWFKEPNYQYFSTSHWFPIVNGYSRAVPPGFTERIARLMTFPDPDAIESIREARIRYVVIHSAEYEAGPGAVARARVDERFRLVASFGSDYLFEFIP
jgi:hypothetical protein